MDLVHRAVVLLGTTPLRLRTIWRGATCAAGLALCSFLGLTYAAHADVIDAGLFKTARYTQTGSSTSTLNSYDFNARIDVSDSGDFDSGNGSGPPQAHSPC